MHMFSGLNEEICCGSPSVGTLKPALALLARMVPPAGSSTWKCTSGDPAAGSWLGWFGVALRGAIPLRRISLIWPCSGAVGSAPPERALDQMAVSALWASLKSAGAVRSEPKVLSSAWPVAGSESASPATATAARAPRRPRG